MDPADEGRSTSTRKWPPGIGYGLSIIGCSIIGIAAVQLWQRGKAVENDIVITGTPRPTVHPAKRTSPTQPAGPLTNPVVTSPAPPILLPSKVVVHVAGAVKKPGV